MFMAAPGTTMKVRPPPAVSAVDPTRIRRHIHRGIWDIPMAERMNPAQFTGKIWRKSAPDIKHQPAASMDFRCKLNFPRAPLILVLTPPALRAQPFFGSP